MVKKNNYTKSKSIYTIKNVHAKTKAGTVYENDYVTIINNDGIYDEMPLFSESNFKYKIGTNGNEKKRHVRTDFVKPENGEYWTKDNIENNTNNEESNIIFKTNYSSLKDFAYYGSAVELIKATINDIILRFPGGLYYYDKNFAPEININGKEYILISNECQIDFWSKNIKCSDGIKNPLRILSLSYKEYNLDNEPIININGSCLDSIIGYVIINDVKFEIYNDNDNNYHLIIEKTKYKYGDTIIEPKQKYFNDFWNSLDDFEKVLLNKDSIPLYTSIFDTPYNNEYGYYFTPRMYTWPTVGNSKSPDLTTSKFKGFLNSLLDLANFHDKYDSDNIWRMMTHESIKNLDWTFKSDEEYDDIDNSRIKSLIHIQGRVYDDIKRYIDNIKYSNTLSYDQKNNLPDYFLTDINNNNGWESKNTVPFSATTNFEIKYEGNNGNISTLEISGKTNSYVNSVFLKRLGLSSNYLQSMKGTRKGIEGILGMFGYINEEDYEIKEYIAKCEKFPTYNEAVCARVEFDYVNSDENTNFMAGYPVALVEKGENDLILIPWYDQNEKYDYDFYFQGKGGWCKTKHKNINRKDITTISTISGDSLYNETEPYMIFVENIDELKNLPNDKIFDGIICYVSDLNGLEKEYGLDLEKGEKTDNSHYFILKNKSLSTKLGYVNNELYTCTGWYQIKETEYNGEGKLTPEGNKVLYLETIVPNYNSNNPHTGKGNYDFGREYLYKYSNLFYEALNDNKCSKLDTITKTEISKIGFGTIKSTENNEKCKIVMTNDNIIYADDDKLKLQDENDSFKTINIKNLSIRFKTKGFGEEYKKYIKEVVLPYLEVMIPSTTIYELLFDNETITSITTNNKPYTPKVKTVNVINNETDIWVEDESWKNNLELN